MFLDIKNVQLVGGGPYLQGHSPGFPHLDVVVIQGVLLAPHRDIDSSVVLPEVILGLEQVDVFPERGSGEKALRRGGQTFLFRPSDGGGRAQCLWPVLQAERRP